MTIQQVYFLFGALTILTGFTVAFFASVRTGIITVVNPFARYPTSKPPHPNLTVIADPSAIEFHDGNKSAVLGIYAVEELGGDVIVVSDMPVAGFLSRGQVRVLKAAMERLGDG